MAIGYKHDMIQDIEEGDEYTHFILIKLSQYPEHLGFTSIGIDTDVEKDGNLFIKEGIAFAHKVLNT